MNTRNRLLFVINILLIVVVCGLLGVWIEDMVGIKDIQSKIALNAILRGVSLYIYLYIFRGVSIVRES